MKIPIKLIFKAVVAGTITGLVFLVFFPFLLVQLNQYWGVGQWDNFILEVVGIILVLAGAFMFFYCSGLLTKLGKGTPAPIEPPQKLVITGIYRYTRNPMYLGYFSIILGEFLFFGYLFLLFYFLFITVFINLYLRLWEEPKLKQRFGKDYEQYIQQVPRWISFSIDKKSQK